MTETSIAARRARRVGGLMASTLLATTALPALAQSSGDVNTPARASLDENGVNLATGEHFMFSTDLSIGSGEAMLAVAPVRGVMGQGGNFVQVVRQVGSIWSATVPNGLGSRSYTFTLAGNVYTSTTGEAATLVNSAGIYTLTTPDGTIYTYGNTTQVGTANNVSSSFRARLTKVTNPAGDFVDLTYKEVTYCKVLNQEPCSAANTQTKVRLQSVRNSYGYQLFYSYDGNAEEPTPNQGIRWDILNSITAFNLAVDYCAPDASICSFSRGWPSTSSSTTTSGNTTTTTVNSGGHTTTYIRDTPPTGSKYSVRWPGSTTYDIEVTWDSAGRTTSVKSDGLTTTYAWTLSGNSLSVEITNPDNTKRTVVSDVTVGLPTSITNEALQTTTMTYDTAGRLKTVTYPEQNKTLYQYDDTSARGNLTEIRQVAKTAGTPADLVTTLHYPASCTGTNAKYCNKPDWVRDPNGQASLKKTDYTYHAASGNVETVTLPGVQIAGAEVRPQVRYHYSDLKAYFKTAADTITPSTATVYRLTKVSTCATTASCIDGADESRSVVDYGPQDGTANNLLARSTTSGSGADFLGNVTAKLAKHSFGYDDYGNLTSVDGPLAGTEDTTTYRYNARRQVVGVILPDPDGSSARLHRATRATYDGRGRTTKVESGTVTGTSEVNWTAFTSAQQAITDYGSNGRKVRDVLDAGGVTRAVTHYSYNSRGLLECTAVRMNSAAWGGQSADCTPNTAGADGPDRITHVAYDPVGRPQVVTDAYGVSGTQAIVQTTTYRANGQVETVKDAENNLTTYEYDGHDRLLKTRFPIATKGAAASSTTDFEQIGLPNESGYDANGNVTIRRLRDGQVLRYTYDALNRRITDDLPAIGWNSDATYSYDLLGRLTKATDANGTGWYSAYEYDALGRVTKQSSNVATAGQKFQYDLAGRKTRQEWHDGFAILYDYDVAGAMTAIREENGGFVLASFGYDDLGRRLSLTRGNGTTTSYSYDPASRLDTLMQDLGGTAQDVTYGFKYNPASQIRSRTVSNDAYTWTGYAGVDRAYASNGLNQLTSAGATALSYDTKGNLTQSGSDVYGYNSRNQMVSGPGVTLLYRNPIGLLNHMIRANNGVTNFDYSGMQVATEFGPFRRYVYGPGVDEPLVWYEGAGTTGRRWLHADERGSIVAVTNASGTAMAVNTYDEFGIPGSGNLGRFGYTGQMWLPEVGLYDYKARMYSPTLGRFMQTDPIGYGDGMNRYNYVGGDPVNASDPSGLLAEFRWLVRPQQIDQPGPTNNNKQSDIVVIGTRNIIGLIEAQYLQWQAQAVRDMQITRGAVGNESRTTAAPQKSEPTPPKKPYGDPVSCLMAMGEGAVDATINPGQLVQDALSGLGFASANAGRVAAAAMPTGRALTIARAAVSGAVVGAVVIPAAAGAMLKLFTDDRCHNG